MSDFTPFGYLRNPAHRATSWREVSGGNLRTSPDRVGVEWAYPVGREPITRVGLGFGAPPTGLTSPYHSCLIIGFDWQLDGVLVEARFFLANDHALCARLTVTNHTTERRHVQISVGAWVNDAPLSLDFDTPSIVTEAPSVHVARGGSVDTELAPGAALQHLAILARGTDMADAVATSAAAREQAEASFAQLLAEDAAFAEQCPTLVGDWPAGWREGLVYDFETTRLLVQPAGGIFTDVWPSWMAAWPRVVLAEGALDMQRLAYADPALAQRAVLSMFRDAPMPNVPCVFEGGEYNMVAADGSRCGTSPAWCLPFLNLELLYLRTLDRDWLRLLYPHARAYLDWWLEHRVDADGWVVYKCTWESGEDGNPRLDPTGSGDADISRRVRPVELQATMAHAAGVLAFFAAELGHRNDVDRWHAIATTYRDRTRLLFDAQAGRFRDQLIDAEPAQTKEYWGIDPFRYAAQSLTPLLIGEPVPEAEIMRHAGPPWTLWPSWTTTLVESAAAAGHLTAVGRFAFDILERVYRVTTRRDVTTLSRPMPGCAPEFWPLDWQTYDGNDAYGWGATTANLLIRHLFGFKESRQTDSWTVDLAPAFPEALLEEGRSYGIRRLNYRGLQFELTYHVGPLHRLVAELNLGDVLRNCAVNAADQTLYESSAPSARHRFTVALGQVVTITLREE